MHVKKRYVVRSNGSKEVEHVKGKVPMIEEPHNREINTVGTQGRFSSMVFVRDGSRTHLGGHSSLKVYRKGIKFLHKIVNRPMHLR